MLMSKGQESFYIRNRTLKRHTEWVETIPSASAALSPVTESESSCLAVKTGSNSATVALIEAFITVISVSR